MLKFLICRFLSLSTSLFLWKTSLCNWIYVEFVSKILIPSEYQDSILRMFRNLPLNVVILASWIWSPKEWIVSINLPNPPRFFSQRNFSRKCLLPIWSTSNWTWEKSQFRNWWSHEACVELQWLKLFCPNISVKKRV